MDDVIWSTNNQYAVAKKIADKDGNKFALYNRSKHAYNTHHSLVVRKKLYDEGYKILNVPDPAASLGINLHVLEMQTKVMITDLLHEITPIYVKNGQKLKDIYADYLALATYMDKVNQATVYHYNEVKKAFAAKKTIPNHFKM